MGSAYAAGADEGSLSDKVMKDAPGTMGGSTAIPNAKPDDADRSLTAKAMNDLPGTKGGSTADPTAVPQTGAATQKAMEDHPGTK
jgi:hypothetical protein